MGEVINLRQERKRRMRLEKEAQASCNRAKTGKSKIDAERARMEAERLARDLDGKKRGDD